MTEGAYTILGEIKEKWGQIKQGIDIQALEKEIAYYQQQAENPQLWEDSSQAQRILKKLAELQKRYLDFTTFSDQIELLQEYISVESSVDLQTELADLQQKIDRYWQERFFAGKYDKGNALVFIQAGAGGVDAQDFAEMITKMYLQYAKSRKFEVNVIEYAQGQEAGLKRSLLQVQGDYAYGLLSQERGVHRLVRISPFNAAGLRHTSFVMVQVLPEIDEATASDIQLDNADLKIDVFRSQGAGGQSVNTTDSAVRITHLPTNTVVSIQTERSQLQNKALAMNILKAKLWELEQIKIRQEKQLYTEDISISWGNHIRSYVLNPYKLVKDQRSGFETTQVEEVLAGNLEPLINSVLIHKHKDKD